MFEQYDNLITVKEMQEMLGVGKNTAYELVRQNKIECFRIGKLWKIPKEAVEKYIREQRACQLSSSQP